MSRRPSASFDAPLSRCSARSIDETAAEAQLGGGATRISARGKGIRRKHEGWPDGGWRSTSKSLMLRHFTILAGAKRGFVHYIPGAARCAAVTGCNRRLQARGSPVRRPPLLCREEFECSGSCKPIGGGSRSPAGRVEGRGFAATPGQDAGAIGKRADRQARSRARRNWIRSGSDFRPQTQRFPQAHGVGSTAAQMPVVKA